MKTYCLYHANCPDGFASAWVVQRNIPKCVLIPVQYGQPPPEMPDCGDLFIVDFSYKRPVTEELIAKYEHDHVTIIDHHKTAMAELEGVDSAIFDMEHSGCILTWKFFNGDVKPPELLLYVEDRDLWRWKLHGSKEVSYAMRTYPYTIEDWNFLMTKRIEDLICDGESILRYINAEIDRLIEHPTWLIIDGHSVPVINASSFFSEMAEALLVKYGTPFAAVWFERKDGKKQYSLRSRSDVDVSEIAKHFNGGGHKNAAGFETPSDHSFERIYK